MNYFLSLLRAEPFVLIAEQWRKAITGSFEGKSCRLLLWQANKQPRAWQREEASQRGFFESA
jgi:hypothetical protein